MPRDRRGTDAGTCQIRESRGLLDQTLDLLGLHPKKGRYTPSRLRNVFLVEELSYSPALPEETWQPPSGITDILRCDEAQLEQLLYVVMNSLQMSADDKPWLYESPTGGSFSIPTTGLTR